MTNISAKYGVSTSPSVGNVYDKAKPTLSKNFAIVLIKTDKGEKKDKFADSIVLNKLKYIHNNALVNKVLLQEQSKIEHIINHAVDVLIVGDQATFNVHPLGRQLAEKAGKRAD